VVGGLIHGHEIVSLLDGKLTKWVSASFVPKRERKKRTKESETKNNKCDELYESHTHLGKAISNNGIDGSR
jgi:3-mercaptopyruvate sulfurtransferase SseA